MTEIYVPIAIRGSRYNADDYNISSEVAFWLMYNARLYRTTWDDKQRTLTSNTVIIEKFKQHFDL